MRPARRLLVVFLVPLLLLLVAADTPPPIQRPFPDFGYLPTPDQYQGPVFRLSQDYPDTMPNGPLPAFMKTDFKNDWENYMMQVRSYCFEGNLEVDWRVQDNAVRKWYHMPWQHYGPSGREGVHGLTREAPVNANQLAPTQESIGQTYAVGVYNDRAGYAIGRVWRDHNDPDETWLQQNGFPEGSVVCKLLFVTIPYAEVPSLANPVQWNAYVTQSFTSADRLFQMVSLIQMDIAVRDSRAPLGWLYGTFQYNGLTNHANRWENLMALGLMWGNDPTITTDEYTNPTPSVTKINPNLKESVINPDPNELPPTHLGWNGRMNGPVDNPRSSCLSCHMTSETPQKSKMAVVFTNPTPPIGSPAWMRWFQNIKCQVPFDPGEAHSLDYNLQMSAALQNFRTWSNTRDGLRAATYRAATSDRLRVQNAPDPGGDEDEEPVVRDAGKDVLPPTPPNN